MYVTVEAIETKDHWRRADAVLDGLVAGEPWTRSAYARGTFRIRYRSEQAYLATVHDGDSLTGAVVLAAPQRCMFGLPYRVLRSADRNVMYTSLLRCRHGRELEVLEALAAATPTLHRVTGAPIARLHRVCQPAVEVLSRTLLRRGHEVVVADEAPCAVVRLDETMDVFWAARGRKARYNLRRSQRGLEEALGGAVVVQRLRGETAGAPSWESAWQVFRAMLRRSRRFCVAGDGVDERLIAWDEAVEVWRRHDTVDLALLTDGRRAVAGELSVVQGATRNLVLMCYDDEYAEFSPGSVLFAASLDDGHTLGDRVVVLGAGGGAWKERWVNEVWRTSTVTWRLGGFVGRCWALVQRCKGRLTTETEPMGVQAHVR